MLALGTRASAFVVEGVERFAVDPRMRAHFVLGERWGLSAGIGLYSQPFIGQKVADGGLFNYQPASGWLVLPDQISQNFDPTLFFFELDLRILRALQATAGASLQLDRGFSIETHGFARDLNDPHRPANTTSAGEIAYGGEFILRKRLSHHLYGWVAYTLMWAKREIDSEGSTSLGRSAYDQRHNLVVVLSTKLPRGWRIGGRFRLSSGLPYTPVIGATGLASGPAPIFGAPLSATFPVFHQLDIRVDKRWVRNRVIITSYLDIQNIYNQQNTEAFIYANSYRRRSGGLGLPILPLLGVRIDI
ncbi:MAG TPA: hypothetical protein ENJ18_06920 [Nannocystis exedens]|nr:hypothetical protein [Nannocystis exedens]